MTLVGRIRGKARYSSDTLKDLRTFLLLIVLILMAAGLSRGVFLRPANLRNLLFQNAILGVVALGQLMVILSGGIDLSIGAAVGLSTVLIMKLQHFGFWGSMIGALAVLLVLGLISGSMITLQVLPPFVVTLGMMLFIFSFGQVLSGGASVYTSYTGAGLSDILLNFNKASILSIPLPAVVWLAALLVAWAFSRTNAGSFVYAFGSNRKAAYISGVPIRRIGIMVYVIAAGCATIGGMLSVARVGEGNPQAGELYMLDSVAAVTVGGASLAGGNGTVVGTLMGVIILGIINNIMNLLGISPLLQHAVKGAIILLAVFMNTRGEK